MSTARSLSRTGASSYDACRVVLEAIEGIGAKDRAAITKAVLATRDHDGLLGRWSFDANGDITLRRTSRLTVTNAEFAFLSLFDLDDADPSSEADDGEIDGNALQRSRQRPRRGSHER